MSWNSRLSSSNHFSFHSHSPLSIKIFTIPTPASTKLNLFAANFPKIASSMMNGCQKSSISRQSYNSLYVNPLNELGHRRSCSDYGCLASKGDDFEDFRPRDWKVFADNKENAPPSDNENAVTGDKENAEPVHESAAAPKQFSKSKSLSTDRILKPSSLEFCMQINEPEKAYRLKLLDPTESENSSSLNIWDYSDSEAAPASSWSTLPNKSLICRPLPIDIGKCTCIIVKEATPEGLSGGTMFSLYTYEGQGRQNRKLAVAHHKRRNGRSQFTIAQNVKGLLMSNSDDSFLGTVTANIMGSKYKIWNQGYRCDSHSKQPKSLLAVVAYVPTVTTCTGSYRTMRAYIPKHQSRSLSLKNSTQLQHGEGLPMDWEGKLEKLHQLVTRVPLYNKISKQYELDFRDRGRGGLRIQRSVKNFQLTMEENGRQTILQLGRVAKSKFVMDYRHPLTGYQAFCICLASIDPKICCTV